MKILMISPFAPYPPDSGGRIRQWEMIKYLGSRHDLTLVFFINRGEEGLLGGVFNGICKRVVTISHSGDEAETTPKSLPWPMRVYGVEPMRSLLQELSSQGFDLLITEFIYMAQHRNLFDIPAVLHEQNIESSIYRQYACLPGVADMEILGIKRDALFWKATWMLMRDYENRVWPGFDLRITVSRADHDEMEARCADGRSIVAENGVDTGSIRMLPFNNSKKILFVGTMNYFPNIDGALYMVKAVMPYIWDLDPSVILCIAGKSMPGQIIELGADRRIELVRDPVNIFSVAAECSASVVPLRLGGGTRIKILEAFALGLPVISTAKGCEGLAVEDGLHLMVRDDPQKFAEAVVCVLNDQRMAEALRREGRSLAEERYDWQRIYAGLEARLSMLTG
jgi:glycosyltransferase involved in cell wall biosynthesis